MRVIRISESGLKDAVNEAVKIIVSGGIVAYPTETFYGLGVKYNDYNALKKLYEIKQRPAEKAMPLIISSKNMLSLISPSINNITEKLMDIFWPGPLTILTAANRELSEFITAGTGKVAVRVPGQSFALDFARALKFPVTATSANISGRPASDNAEDVKKYFGESLDLIIDGGKTSGGMPSTIVDATGEGLRIARSGAISEKEIYKYIQD